MANLPCKVEARVVPDESREARAHLVRVRVRFRVRFRFRVREARAHEVADVREVLAGGRPAEGRLELGGALAEAEVDAWFMLG